MKTSFFPSYCNMREYEDEIAAVRGSTCTWPDLPVQKRSPRPQWGGEREKGGRLVCSLPSSHRRPPPTHLFFF